jgi:hypothetical protein
MNVTFQDNQFGEVVLRKIKLKFTIRSQLDFLNFGNDSSVIDTIKDYTIITLQIKGRY